MIASHRAELAKGDQAGAVERLRDMARVLALVHRATEAARRDAATALQSPRRRKLAA